TPLRETPFRAAPPPLWRDFPTPPPPPPPGSRSAPRPAGGPVAPCRDPATTPRAETPMPPTARPRPRGRLLSLGLLLGFCFRASAFGLRLGVGVRQHRHGHHPRPDLDARPHALQPADDDLLVRPHPRGDDAQPVVEAADLDPAVVRLAALADDVHKLLPLVGA